jgi:3-isopropylmalate/(R)-2-methylmalate dehydratase large subunit
MDMEARMSLCNMSIEFGAKMGLIAPDQTTFDYMCGRPFAPCGAQFEAAVAHWRTLVTDRDAVFDREVSIDAAKIYPQVSWGTSPEQVMAIDGTIPDPQQECDPARREAMLAALDYMHLRPGQPISGTPLDRVFIGSCANSRLSDLQAAARVVRGCKVAPHVRAWVVPGSLLVKHAAEQEGLDKVFLDAGFEWRAPGCSMCVGANGDLVAPGNAVCRPRTAISSVARDRELGLIWPVLRWPQPVRLPAVSQPRSILSGLPLLKRR